MKPIVYKLEIDYVVPPRNMAVSAHMFDTSTHALARYHYGLLEEKSVEFHGTFPPATTRFVRICQIYTPYQVWTCEGVSHDKAPVGFKESLNVWELFALARKLHAESLSEKTRRHELNGHVLAFRSSVPGKHYRYDQGVLSEVNDILVPALYIKHGIPMSIHHVYGCDPASMITPILGATSCGFNLGSGTKLLTGESPGLEVLSSHIPEGRAGRRHLTRLLQAVGQPGAQ